MNSFGGASSAAEADKEDERNRALAKRAQAGDYNTELIEEQLARNLVFLGEDGLKKLLDAFVVVVGCGGVGSHCAASLARSGVSKIRLIDFDQVTLSSLNRHAVATLDDVGTSKVRCLQRRLMGIAPWVRFELFQEKFDEPVASRMLGRWEGSGRQPDFIVDAIDNVDTKVALLKFCHDRGLPVISSMGAGLRSDPTRIVIGDISTTTDDGLSRATRRRLKLQGVVNGIPTVFSTEQTSEDKAKLLPLSDEEFKKGKVGDLGPMANFRVRILPVLGSMPAIFGLTVANYVILAISGYPTDYAPAKGREKMYDGILNFVQGSEERLARMFEPGIIGLRLPLNIQDVSFLSDDFYRSRSLLSGLTTRLVLVRWRKPETTSIEVTGSESTKDLQKRSTLRLSDLVCLTKEEAIQHEREVFKEGKKVEDVYDVDTVTKVDAAREALKAYEKFRY